jgi:hypothetical protein
MLHLVDVTRKLNAKGRIIHSWEYQHALNIILRMVRRKVERIRQRGWFGASYRLPAVFENNSLLFFVCFFELF